MAWIPMLAEDARPEVADLLVDQRASHYWDGAQMVGRDVATILGQPGGTAAWDVFLVYGPDARWGDRPAAAGSPVISDSGTFERALAPYLG